MQRLWRIFKRNKKNICEHGKMNQEDLTRTLIDFVDEYGYLVVEKIAERLYRIHRGNLENIIRDWTAELDKLKHPVEIKK